MTSFAFSKNLRLANSSEFSAVFQDAPFRASHANFLILARPSTTSNPRLGIVVAKKHVRRAVSRNRVKRVVREGFRLQQHKLPKIDAIVLARRGADALSNQELQHILDGLWKRVAKKAKQDQAAASQPGA